MPHTAKLLATVSLVSLLISSTAQAAAPSNWYLGASGDFTWARHTNMGGGANVALGYQFAPGSMGDFRLEGQVGYHGAGGEDGFGDLHYFTYMGNLYYDFNRMFPQKQGSGSGWHISPYIGAGLGDAAIHYGSADNNIATTFHHHNNSFAWQGMAGINLTSASMPNMDWIVGYRYLGTSETNLHAQNLELGVRFRF
jgi:opacity protein-like surface antigen